MTLHRLGLTLLLTFALTAGVTAGTLAEYKFDDETKTAEFRHLTETLRCLVCQNETIAGSNAELAVDLRNEIYDMMKSGKTKDDIIEFMVARYGDFVLYSPPVKPSTYPIWFGPLIIFIIGAIILIRVLRRKKETQEIALSEAEQERLSHLTQANVTTEDKRQ